MIGGGEMEDEIRRRVEKEAIKNVQVHGSVSREQTLQLLRSAGAFLLASRWEGLPIAPLEAMQFGLPVVLSDVGGNPEVIEDGISGYTVPQEDTAGYAARLRELAERPEAADRLAEAALNRVQALFSRSRMVADYLALYRSLI